MAEKVTINHFCHEHPLTLTDNVGIDGEDIICFACEKKIVSECAYVCVEHPYCSYKSRSFIHQRCAELPNQILHPSHPRHTLNLLRIDESGYRCNLCRCRISPTALRYRCHRCDFDIDITCKELNIDELFGEKWLAHPLHLHPLTLMNKMAFPFTCDACGIEDRDIAYSCSICNLLIHKACALLPTSLPTNHHHHQLSLVSCFPIQFRRYIYECAICGESFLNMAFWVYYCGDCRYFVHLKCATSAKRIALNEQDRTNDVSDLVKFPVSDPYNKLIKPFVMREMGLDSIPDAKDMPTAVTMPETTANYSHLFNSHKHPLSLVSEDDVKAFMKVEDGDGDEDEDEDEDDELKICDVCITPISSPPYYECAPCKYFVHLICYLLPKKLSSLISSSSATSQYGECPETPRKNHNFTLYTSSKGMDANVNMHWCHVCRHYTNGIMYRCEECGMRIDLKCASLPAAIRHASHPHPNLVMTKMPPQEDRENRRECKCCGYYIDSQMGYRCSKDGCNFSLHFKCAMLPRTARNPEWDKHPLLLTSDASADHPSDFFCDFCEREMHPKRWMYHCHQCDTSFHIYCLWTAFGWHRNVKFGRRFELDGIHPHPLTYNYITLKKWCDNCHKIKVYSDPGFECKSCYFAVCLRCGNKELAKK